MDLKLWKSFLFLSLAILNGCRSTEVKMIVDILLSMKPAVLNVNLNCWKKDAVKMLSNMLNENGISVLQNSKMRPDHQTVFLTDIACADAENFLEQNAIVGNFYSPYRWLILGNSVENKSSASVPEQLSNIDIRVDSSVVVINKYKNDFIPWSIYKLSNNQNWFMTYSGNWNRMTGYVTPEDVKRSLALKRLNLHGTHIKIINVISDPKFIRETRLTKELQTYSVTIMNYNLITFLMDFMNATRIDYFTDTWGKYHNGTWTGLLAFIYNEGVELSGTPLFIFKERLDIVEYLMHPAITDVKFVFRRPPLSSHYNLYLLPFNSKVWYSLLVSTVLIFLVLLINASWEQKVAKKAIEMQKQDMLRANLSDVLLFVHSLICQQGSPHELKGILGRSVIFITCVTFTFLYTSYSANVVALLQSSSSHIRTMEDLFNSKLEIAIHDTPYNKVLFNPIIKDPMHYAPYNKIGTRKKKLTFLDLEEGVKKMQKGQFALFMDRGIGYIYVNKYFEEGQKCGLHEVNYEQGQDVWLGARKNTPYKEIFKIGLFRIKEHGLDTREYLKIYAEKPKCLGNGGSFVNVSVVDCYPAFVMLMYGYIAAFSLLVIEILLNYCHSNKVARC